MGNLIAILAFCEGTDRSPPITRGLPSQRTSKSPGDAYMRQWTSSTLVLQYTLFLWYQKVTRVRRHQATNLVNADLSSVVPRSTNFCRIWIKMRVFLQWNTFWNAVCKMSTSLMRPQVNTTQYGPANPNRMILVRRDPHVHRKLCTPTASGNTRPSTEHTVRVCCTHTYNANLKVNITNLIGVKMLTWTVQNTEGRTDRQTDRQKDRQTNRQTDEQTDGKTVHNLV